MGVKLSGTLPGGDRSGIDVIHGELVRHPEKTHYVIAVIDCSSTHVNHGAEGETYTPTARLINIEVVLDEDDLEVVADILGRRRAERVGNGTIAFDLGLGDLTRAPSATGASE